MVCFFQLSLKLFLIFQQTYWVYVSPNDIDSYSNDGKVTAIKGSSKAVYILKDGIKHMVSDWASFLVLGFTDIDIHTSSDSLINGYPTGDPIHVQPPESEESLLQPPLCPCSSSSSHDLRSPEKLQYQTSRTHLTCIIQNSWTEEMLSALPQEHLKINYRYIPEVIGREYSERSPRNQSVDTLRGCDVLINLTNRSSSFVSEMDTKCPGICHQIPYTEVPLQWLLPPYIPNRSISCSMTLSSILLDVHFLNDAEIDSSQAAKNIDLILKSLARRRLEECFERGLWPMGSFNRRPGSGPQTWSNISYIEPVMSIFPKRKIYGLIVWIGSNQRLPLAMDQTQMLTLQDRTLNDTQKIFGWVATEDVYPCNASAPNCKYKHGYHWMMPSGKMAHEGDKGWGCAQRRPLRAMAHTLLLFDPDFLFIVDDDTYVRVQYLAHGSNMSSAVFGSLKDTPQLLGQLNGGNRVTKGGFLYGGAGYLMGKGLIDVLNSHTLLGPPQKEDRIRNEKHMNHLGLFEEALDLTRLTCPDCFQFQGNMTPHGIGLTAQLQVRLIDLCTNMLSEEGTCYHSDHAISRCLVHGAYADVFNVACSGALVVADPPFETGMCMGVDVCRDNLLTCHRWLPNMTSPDLNPMPFVAKRR